MLKLQQELEEKRKNTDRKAMEQSLVSRALNGGVDIDLDKGEESKDGEKCSY